MTRRTRSLHVLRDGLVVGTVTGTCLDTRDRRLRLLWKDGVQASGPGGDDDSDAREIVQVKPGDDCWISAYAEGLGRLGYDVDQAFREAGWAEWADRPGKKKQPRATKTTPAAQVEGHGACRSHRSR